MVLIKPNIFDSFFYRRDRTWNICPLHNTDEIALPATDGCKIVCLFVHSNTREKKGSIFLLHGRVGNASRYSYYVKPLVKEGFDIFIADWRGYGKSEGRANHLNVAEDSKLALMHFLSMKETRNSRKILWGLSIGGQVAIHLAKEFRGYFDALVTEGSISSFKQAARDYYHKALQVFVKEPYSAAHDIKEIVDLPKLIIHSTEDNEISFQNAETLFRNAKEPKSLLKIKGNHLYGLNRKNAAAYIKEFKRVAWAS
ncbi:MAG TPA: alpha/beta fold hydrolase [Chitinophagaceae bacterium]|jgi:hypothetical protein